VTPFQRAEHTVAAGNQDMPGASLVEYTLAAEYLRLYKAASVFARCYQVGHAGPIQLPPGKQCNEALAALDDALDFS
jgi:hypothetical protein